jgi:CheY-like chemotaxis protein
MSHRVMLIDDSESDLLYTRIILQRASVPYEVLAFETAQDALRALKAGGEPVDLILLDINMPGMNGFEFLEAYQALRGDQQADVVVVMLTSSPDPADRERALAFPCVKGYVTKPIDRASADGLVRLLGGA